MEESKIGLQPQLYNESARHSNRKVKILCGFLLFACIKFNTYDMPFITCGLHIIQVLATQYHIVVCPIIIYQLY